ncbi:MAG: tRNA (N(6)-L-threonylcarbamoyladenosine(37)-C(2))-methylthiotransferase MtaB [Muribaculaceae bacterium]|nr:tRNA (N(6)-L-threonylcarbamoyladenosine(37)-C(2))-methylthiotransferase MtaB [Muribaculaceae bacterium]MDE6552055.1 tRNA (N(6)-L-threonylcarbamoyladenosine(37)-C(2))-methylthiotransferase MtaB [Muribaculaceae bacterium]
MNYELPLRASYHTLGCKLNFSETSAIGMQLARRGIIRAQGDEAPDIVVVNTCSVTEVADKKGRSLIRRLRNRWPDATLVVTGCYAQLKPQEVACIEGVDIVLGNDEKLRISDFLEEWERDRRSRVAVHDYLDIREFRGACERGDRTRYWLKVQDGCDYFCTYCTIPFARGRSRSGNIDELVAEAEKAAAAGGKEIVLTGVNVGCFGKDTGEDFLTLLKRLDAVEGIERYRISSIEPNLLTEDIVRWIAGGSRAFMPSFHIPLQSGSDEVLRLMNRRYRTDLFSDRITMILDLMPDAFIGVDIIAGARGETESEWEKSFAFAESLPVSRYHVFPYSERPGTKALGIDHQVSQEEKHRRVAELTMLSDHKLKEYSRRFFGTERLVLWEHPDSGEEGFMYGHTDNYLRVRAKASDSLYNTISPALLNGFLDTETLTAQLP